MTKIFNNFNKLINLLNDILTSNLLHDYDIIKNACISTILNGGKIYVIGNGGSAADANHFTGELLGRFLKERKSLPAISLTSDNATITAIANDYGYGAIFERQLEGLFNPELDVLLALSTSGNSENIIRAIQYVNEVGGISINFLGKDGGHVVKINNLMNLDLIIPSDDTPRIQELHKFFLHQLAQDIEDTIFMVH